MLHQCSPVRFDGSATRKSQGDLGGLLHFLHRLLMPFIHDVLLEIYLCRVPFPCIWNLVRVQEKKQTGSFQLSDCRFTWHQPTNPKAPDAHLNECLWRRVGAAPLILATKATS